MKVNLLVSLDLDAGLIELDAKRFRKTLEESVAAVISDCEARLSDSCRFRDAVQGVGVRLLDSGAP